MGNNYRLLNLRTRVLSSRLKTLYDDLLEYVELIKYLEISDRVDLEELKEIKYDIKAILGKVLEIIDPLIKPNKMIDIESDKVLDPVELQLHLLSSSRTILGYNALFKYIASKFMKYLDELQMVKEDMMAIMAFEDTEISIYEDFVKNKKVKEKDFLVEIEYLKKLIYDIKEESSKPMFSKPIVNVSYTEPKYTLR